jgi:MFS transporter, putative metabolite:H+ symporter
MKHPISYIRVTIALMAAGYFVNIYHVIAFSIVGKQSLIELLNNRYSLDKVQELHSDMVQLQMLGALLGSFLWGYLGDKIGRMSALFTSTLLCSMGLFFSALLPEAKLLFPNDIEMIYKVLRFIVGFGLSGELAASIVMVSEVMHTDVEDRTKTHGNRILGTTVVVMTGVLGGVFAGWIHSYGIFQYWKNMYYLGAVMGLAVIVFRISVYGSELFLRLKYDQPKKSTVKRGNWWRLFKEKELRHKLWICFVFALPTWFTLGVLLEHPANYGYEGKNSADTYMWGYLGLSIGSVFSGLLSYYFKAHQKVLKLAHILSFVSILIYLMPFGREYFNGKCFLIGLGRSYWCLFVSIIPEYFGTNLRCSATTIVINAQRAILFVYVIFTTQLSNLIFNSKLVNVVQSKSIAALILSVILFSTAVYYISHKDFEESFGKDLDFET